MLRLIILNRNLVTMKQSHFPVPWVLATPKPAFSLFPWIYLFCVFPVNRPMMWLCVIFPVCLFIQHRVLRFIHSLAWINILPFSWPNNIPLGGYITCCLFPNRHWPVFSFVSNATMNTLDRIPSVCSPFFPVSARHIFMGLYGNPVFGIVQKLPIFLLYFSNLW